MKIFLIVLLCLWSLPLGGSELGRVVTRLKEPTLAQAKIALEDLEKLIAEGDARTVTLGKKMQRSIRRIFTAEFKITEARKKADEKEARAKQLVINGKKWLKPNAHGRTNKIAASQAFEEARTIRQKSIWDREEFSRNWAKEVADFEKMLGDLEFSKEHEALSVLASMLVEIVKRTTWVETPDLNFGPERIAFLTDRVANGPRWLLLARAAEDAKDYELAYGLYRKAGDDKGRKRTGNQFAGSLAADGYVGSAINYYQRTGNLARASALQAGHPELKSDHFRPLAPQAQARHVAPACVRILTPFGHQSGFFVKSGGYVATCKAGLRKGEDQPASVKVMTEDGRKFRATIFQESDTLDVAILKIDLEEHDLLEVETGEDLSAGGSLSLFGFPAKDRNSPERSLGTVLKAKGIWRDNPVIRLALEANSGQRGAPLVDSRGRARGLFLSSKTGSAYVLDGKAVKQLLD